MASYLALIHSDDGRAFGVSFPDVPGCVALGKSVAEALANAREALALHFDGTTPPPPSRDVAVPQDLHEGLVGIAVVEPA